MNNIDINENYVKFPMIHKEIYKKNCNVDVVYSMTDDECSKLCDNSGLFVNRHGICINSIVFNQKTVENTCDVKKGVVAYLTSDPAFGNSAMLCLSIDPGVRPNNLKLPNTLCPNAVLEVNYKKKFPQLNDCQCDTNTETLIEIPNSSTIRTRGYCTNNNLLPIFQMNNLIHSNKKIY